jgi:site-specific recombinase XerD
VDAPKAMHEHLEEREGTEGNAWLFQGQRGERLNSSGIRYPVQRYACDARLEGVTPHTLATPSARTWWTPVCRWIEQPAS